MNVAIGPSSSIHSQLEAQKFGRGAPGLEGLQRVLVVSGDDDDHRHVRRHTVEAGYPAPARAAETTVQRLVNAQPLRPVQYCLERRDPRFLPKMQEVLPVRSRSRWMKKPGYRPLVTPLRTYGRWPVNIPQWPAIMSTSAPCHGHTTTNRGTLRVPPATAS